MAGLFDEPSLLPLPGGFAALPSFAPPGPAGPPDEPPVLPLPGGFTVLPSFAQPPAAPPFQSAPESAPAPSGSPGLFGSLFPDLGTGLSGSALDSLRRLAMLRLGAGLLSRIGARNELGGPANPFASIGQVLGASLGEWPGLVKAMTPEPEKAGASPVVQQIITQHLQALPPDASPAQRQRALQDAAFALMASGDPNAVAASAKVSDLAKQFAESRAERLLQIENVSMDGTPGTFLVEPDTGKPVAFYPTVMKGTDPAQVAKTVFDMEQRFLQDVQPFESFKSAYDTYRSLGVAPGPVSDQTRLSLAMQMLGLPSATVTSRDPETIKTLRGLGPVGQVLATILSSGETALSPADRQALDTAVESAYREKRERFEKVIAPYHASQADRLKNLLGVEVMYFRNPFVEGGTTTTKRTGSPIDRLDSRDPTTRFFREAYERILREQGKLPQR